MRVRVDSGGWCGDISSMVLLLSMLLCVFLRMDGREGDGWEMGDGTGACKISTMVIVVVMYCMYRPVLMPGHPGVARVSVCFACVLGA